MNHEKPNIYKSNICPPCPHTATAFEKFIYWLGIGLGSGLPKKAAGTWGTLGGLIIALPMLLLGFWGFFAITVLGCLIGSFICGKTSDLMQVHDDPHIVFDEWVGMWIALLPISYKAFPEFGEMINYFIFTIERGILLEELFIFFAIPFILFRFFDIIKPFPIKWVDKNVSGGFGILIDDVLAGVMAMICYLILVYSIIILFFIP